MGRYEREKRRAYLTKESRKVHVVLIEDQDELREKYADILWNHGFRVRSIRDGCYLEKVLRNDFFDIVLSDTEMEKMDGPEAVKMAIEKVLLDDNKTLIIGMSDDPVNEEYWRGIAHIGCFYKKQDFDCISIGRIVKNCWEAYISDCKAWKMKIPRCV